MIATLKYFPALMTVYLDKSRMAVPVKLIVGFLLDVNRKCSFVQIISLSCELLRLPMGCYSLKARNKFKQN